MKYPVVLIAVITSCQTYATPTGFGTFTRDATPAAGSIVSGSYTTLSGAQGTYRISAGASNGYSGRNFTVGSNGIEIRNDSNTNTSNDAFSYTFTIIPNDNTAMHTIKIGQASYTTDGNSEVARQTLSFEENEKISVPVRAFIKENSPIEYHYEAMGDYFMGRKVQNTTDTFLAEQYLPKELQLRKDDSGIAENKLYYFNIPKLKGAGANSSL